MTANTTGYFPYGLTGAKFEKYVVALRIQAMYEPFDTNILYKLILITLLL